MVQYSSIQKVNDDGHTNMMMDGWTEANLGSHLKCRHSLSHKILDSQILIYKPWIHKTLDSQNLGFTNPWIHKTLGSQILNSQTLDSQILQFTNLGFTNLKFTNLRFTNLEFTNPWIHKSWIHQSLDSPIQIQVQNKNVTTKRRQRQTTCEVRAISGSGYELSNFANRLDIIIPDWMLGPLMLHHLPLPSKHHAAWMLHHIPLYSKNHATCDAAPPPPAL